MIRFYYVDDEENIYVYYRETEFINIMTNEIIDFNFSEVTEISSDDLVKALLNKLKNISYALHTEISTRNHEGMTDYEKGFMKGLLLGSHIFHSRKIPL